MTVPQRIGYELIYIGVMNAAGTRMQHAKFLRPNDRRPVATTIAIVTAILCDCIENERL